MNRIENHLQRLNEKGEKAFITYMTAGLPDTQGMKRYHAGAGRGRR